MAVVPLEKRGRGMGAGRHGTGKSEKAASVTASAAAPQGDSETRPDGRRPDGRRPDRGARMLARMIPAVTEKALARRGLAAAGLVRHWAEIVGPVLSAASVPERMIRDKSGEHATLVVKVKPGVALEMQHLEPLVLERINGHFGFRAVTRLRLVQGRLPTPPAPRKPRPPPDPAEVARLEARLAPIADDQLRSTLAALGRSLLARKG